jgi:hypothetical protein
MKMVTEATPWSARCHRDDPFGALPRGTFLGVQSVRILHFPRRDFTNTAVCTFPMMSL